jgi:Kelch motif
MSNARHETCGSHLFYRLLSAASGSKRASQRHEESRREWTLSEAATGSRCSAPSARDRGARPSFRGSPRRPAPARRQLRHTAKRDARHARRAVGLPLARGPVIVRANYTATLLSTGKVLVAGGDTPFPVGPDELPSAELYDPATGTWSPTGSMRTARKSATAVRLPNGEVLVAGGCTSACFVSLASVELYDPLRGVWSPTGSMKAGRNRPSGILLRNQRVLVLGGIDARGVELASADSTIPPMAPGAPPAA